MKMIKKYRKLIVIAVITILLGTYTAIVATRKYGDYREIDLIIDEIEYSYDPIILTIGEEYDLESDLKKAKSALDKELISSIDGEFSLETSYISSVTLQGTKVKAQKCGIGKIGYYYNYTSRYFTDSYGSGTEGQSIGLLNLNFIVLSEESEYVNVNSIEDISEGNKTFVLKNDIVISEPYDNYYILEFFNGILLNPDGYTITIEEESGLTALFRYNMGLCDGVKLDASINSDNAINSICGLVNFNEGIIKDCELSAEIITTRGIMMLHDIYGTTICCNYIILPDEGEINYSGFHSNIWGNLKDNDFLFTFSGETDGIEETDEIIGITTRYRIIIEEP